MVFFKGEWECKPVEGSCLGLEEGFFLLCEFLLGSLTGLVSKSMNMKTEMDCVPLSAERSGW